MATMVTPLHKDKHGGLRIKDTADCRHVKDRHLLPLVVHEFVAASAEFPVVFVKNAATGQFQAVAMLGLRPQENLYVGPEGWRGLYRPGCLRNHPFVLIPSAHNSGQMMVGISESTASLSDDEGQSLFEHNGDESAYLKERKQALLNYYEQDRITQGFIDIVIGLDLLTQRNLNVEIGAEKLSIDGIYLIDEARFNALPTADFNDLRKRGFLQAIYAHLISLHQIQRLARMKSRL